MDNITHTLTGFALARTGLERRTPGATLALVLGSNVPDLDVVTWLGGSASYLHYHRDLTHSVVGAPLAALALAAALRACVREARFRALLLCCLIGAAGHVFMDLWTSYGTRVLAPFDRTWYTWDLVFIVDPLILLLLGTALWLGRGARAARLATLALALVACYVGGRAVLHHAALVAARARLAEPGLRRLAALPDPLDPTRWRVLADTGPAYWTGEQRLVGASPPLLRRPKQPEDPIVQRVREESVVAAIFLDFSSFPYLSVVETPGGRAITWTDLRFERPGRESFVTRVLVAPDGRIRSQDFRF